MESAVSDVVDRQGSSDYDERSFNYSVKVGPLEVVAVGPVRVAVLKRLLAV